MFSVQLDRNVDDDDDDSDGDEDSDSDGDDDNDDDNVDHPRKERSPLSLPGWRPSCFTLHTSSVTLNTPHLWCDTKHSTQYIQDNTRLLRCTIECRK